MANNGSVGTKSRFSTLKVFKLGSSHSLPTLGQAAPPPPPPKDDTIYSSSLYSRSHTTLQSPTVSESTMNTGSSSSPRGLPFLSPQLASSKVSLVSSNGGGESGGGVHAMSRKASTFFTRFGKKKSSTAPPESQGDAGITTPWNFQHQIHVNDSLVGLPPSWSSQLAQAGFSEEEIALLHARRTASASNPSVYLGRPASPATTLSSTHSSQRPLSPAYNNAQQQQPNSTVGQRPGPRTSSLRRPTPPQALPQSQYPPPPVADNRSTPSLSGSSTRSRSRQASQTSLSSSSATGDPPPPPNRPPPLPPSSADQASRSRSGSLANIHPPRRPFVVTNGSPISHTPPPAYPGGPVFSEHQADVKDKQLYNRRGPSSPVDAPPSLRSPGQPSTPPRPQTHRNNPSSSSITTPMSLVETPRRKSKRFSTVRPPRLSLHQSAGEDSKPASGTGGLGLGMGMGLGLGIDEDKGWGDSVFEAMSATSSKFDPKDIPAAPSSQLGSSGLLPSIVLSPTSDGSNAKSTSPSSSTRSASPAIAPLNLIPSSTSPKNLPSTSTDNVLMLDDDKRRTYKPGESSPMWQEIIDIMDPKSPTAAAMSPRSPGLESTAPSSANTQINFTLTGQEHRPRGNGQPHLDDEEDDYSRSRLSTATVLASAYQQSSRTHLSPEQNRYSMLSVDSPVTGRYAEGRSPTNRDSSQSTSSVMSAATIKNVVDVTRAVKASLVTRDRAASTSTSSGTTPTSSATTQDKAAPDETLDDLSDQEDELDVYHHRYVEDCRTRPPSSPMSGSFGGSEETSTSRDTTTTSTTATSSTHATPSPDDDAVYGVRKMDPPDSARQGGSDEWDESDVYDAYQDEDEGQEIVYDRSNGFAKPVNGYLAPAPYGTGQSIRGAGGLLERPGQEQGQQPPPVSPISPGAVLAYYEDRSPEPDRMDFVDEVIRTRNAFAGDQPEDVRSIYSSEDHSTQQYHPMPQERPTIVINNAQGEASSSRPTPPDSASSMISTAQSPMRTYPGWVSELVRPLIPCIDESIGDPRIYYQELVEIAECESGSSIFAARVVDPSGVTGRSLSVGVRARDSSSAAAAKAAMSKNLGEGAGEVEETLLVAIKIVPLNPGGTPKLKDIEQELALLKNESSPSLSSLTHPIYHQNIVIPDTVYIDLEEDSLWLRMELMERSVADVIMLIEEGLMLQERMIGRVAADVLQGLRFLETHRIAHRDLRSDNLLISREGVVKIADFSSALKVTPGGPLCTDPAGVVYWQAPEVRQGPYDPMKVDVWSLGATVWEMAESQPPFSANDAANGGDNRVTVTEQWPPLSQPNIYSPAFHDFLKTCSQSAKTRPSPSALLKSPFITNACGRLVLVQLLSQCVSIEQMVQERENDAA